MAHQIIKTNTMKHFFTFFISLLISFSAFSQVITLECNNTIIVISIDELVDDLNANVDWNGDGVINTQDYIIYLSDIYNCNNEDDGDSSDNGDSLGDEDDGPDWFNDFDLGNDGVFSFECNDELITIDIANDLIQIEVYIDSLLTNNDCEEWSIVSDWEDYDWDSVWEDYGLADSLVDWNNIPWDEIIDTNVFPEDLIDYLISLAEGQPFNWETFIMLYGCVDDDAAMQGGLAGIGVLVEGCEDGVAYLNNQGYGCFDEITIPGLGTITPSEVCCETCGEEDVSGCVDELACNYNSDKVECDYSCYGCMDESACNYDSNATLNDECLYEVECLVSPCSISEDPGISGAYCVDDYCGSCCALWYDSDGLLISNSCDVSDNPALGIWNDVDNNQYVEITEDVIAFYSYLDDEDFMCWYYWEIEYVYLGDGGMMVIDPEYGDSVQIQSEILDSGDLQITDPDEENIILSPLTELPELEMCDILTNEVCEEFQGQWVYLYPGTDIEVIWMEIDPLGVDFFILLDDDCVEYIPLSYDSIEGSDNCTLFAEAYDSFEFGELSLNSDGTLSFSNMPGFPEDWPEVWNAGEFDTEEFMVCFYGCTDPSACNYDPFANIDNGTCGLIDDCGVCQIPYCYDMTTNAVEYVSEDACDALWIGNDCENNDYCLSSPMNPYWNSSCNSTIEENETNNTINYTTNIMGQLINSYSKSGLKVIFYNDGSVQKKHIIK